MIYYIILIALILLLRQQVFAQNNPVQREIVENKYCLYVWVVIILLAALRSHKSGMAADTGLYMIDYLDISKMTFKDIAERYEGYLGYYYTSKLFSLAKLPVQVWLGFVEAVYVFALSRFVNKYSKDKLFSILVFVTIGLFSFSFAGLKQVLSMSLMMLAYLQFVDKKYVAAVCLVAAAYFCHPAGMIFLAAFPFYLLRKKRNGILLIILSTLFVMVFSSLFLTTLVDILNNEHYEGYLEYDNTYNSTTLIFYAVIVMAASLGYKEYALRDKAEARICLGFSIMAIGLQSMSSISPNMFRLALLYTPFMMILLPNSSINNRNLRLLLMFFVTFYFLYTSRNQSYLFFWQ